MEDKKYKRPKRKIRYFRILLTLVVLCFLVFAFLRLPIFQVRKISVIGNERLDENTIISYAKVSTKDNIIFLKKDQVRENTLTNTFIEDVEVKKSLFRGLTLNIKERQAAATIKLGDKYLLLDSFGIIIDQHNSLMLNLCLINGIKINGQVNLGQDIFSFVSEEKNNLLKELLNGENIYKFKSVSLEEDQAELVLKDGVIVAFGSYTKVDYKLKVLDLMIKKIAEDGSKNPSMILMEDGPVPILVVD